MGLNAMQTRIRNLFFLLAPLFSMLLLSMAETGTAAEKPDTAVKKHRRPNVVVILSDDQGWGDFSIHGNTNLSTPNIDSLAADGAMFERFFVCPVCSPTRAEMLTGRYHARCGVRGVSTGAERMNLDERTIAETLQAAGYATGAFGKWHNGMQPPYHPNSRGFAEYYGFCSGHWGHYFDPVLEHNGKIVRGKGFIIDDLTNHAIDFIEQNQERPFFCYLPYNTPHSPFQVPDRFYDKFASADIKLRNRDPKKEELVKTKAALAMCENIDWNVGRVLKKLDELKLAENTIVIYFCDNGPNTWRYNGDMKGRKGSTDEGGVRVGCFVRWPRGIEAGRKISQIAGAIDLAPTLAELCGASRVGDKPLDGRSLKPLLTGEVADWPDRVILSAWRNNISARNQQYRLDAAGRLFDMAADPGQRRDCTAEHPRIAAALKDEVQGFRQDVMAKLGPEDRPFPVGFTAGPSMLPARDGVGHGGVKRSARAPNCSFLTHWTKTDDAITWDVEAATEGDYEVVLYYTCPRSDVGSTIELEFAGKKIRATISEPHDPPLRGAESDRADRGSESYVKDFRPLRLGVLRMKKGRSQLRLSASKVAGKQVADVRMLVVTKVK